MRDDSRSRISRRGFGRALSVPVAFYTVRGLFAEQLALTPSATEGPFYPDKIPLGTDNDLIVIDDAATPALGEIAHLTGRVLTQSGAPARNVTVAIWQVDANGVYIHSCAPGRQHRDTNFQGVGRFETGSTGEYRFRTIKPVQYRTARRAPHIHIAVNRNGRRALATQLFPKDHESNARDPVIRGARRRGGIDSLFAEFKPVPESKIGELSASFDLVIAS